MSGARTHRPQCAAWEAVKDIPGMTYRRFDYWCMKGYIRFKIERDKPKRSGNWRTITEDEIRVLGFMAQLVNAGVLPAEAAPVARRLAHGRTARLGQFTIMPAEREQAS